MSEGACCAALHLSTVKGQQNGVWQQRSHAPMAWQWLACIVLQFEPTDERLKAAVGAAPTIVVELILYSSGRGRMQHCFRFEWPHPLSGRIPCTLNPDPGAVVEKSCTLNPDPGVVQ